MPMTLLEASKRHSGDVVRSTMIEVFARANPLLQAVRWLDIPGGSYHYTQEGALSGFAFRGINGSYSESTSIVVPQVEYLRIAGGDVDVDTALLDMNGQDIREQEEVSKLKAMSLGIASRFIKGDSVANPLEFDGLQNRLTGSQLLKNKASGTDGGDPLSLSMLDAAIDAVDSPTHLIMSKAMARLLSAGAKSTDVSGYVTWDKNEYGDRIMRYDGLEILAMDYDEFGARFLGFTELGSTGSTATATSIYVVNLNDGYVQGLQNGAPRVRDLGEIDAQPVMRTRFEWYVGLATMHPRCASRLYGISNAPVIA